MSPRRLPLSQPIASIVQRAPALALLLCASTGLLGGCTYEREISRSGMLIGVEGAEFAGKAKHDTRNVPDFLRTPDEGIRVEHDDGSITLYTKSMRQLMTQITIAIQNGERELFVDQILSTKTKEEFIERGLDPGMAFDELVTRQRDIFRLFYFMPMGEYTPGVFLKGIGRNEFRLKISRANNQTLRWTGIDASFEKTNYRLLWFVR